MKTDDCRGCPRVGNNQNVVLLRFCRKAPQNDDRLGLTADTGAHPTPARPGCELQHLWELAFQAESTTSTTGRPALRLGTHCWRNKRHQRNQPAGTQIRATLKRACVLTVTGTVSR